MTVCPCAISKPVLTMFLKWKQETSKLTVTPISWQWFGCVVFFSFSSEALIQYCSSLGTTQKEWSDTYGCQYCQIQTKGKTKNQQLAQLEEDSSVNKEEGLTNPHRHGSDVHHGDVHTLQHPSGCHLRKKSSLLPITRLSCLYDLLTGGWLHLMKKISFSSPHPTTCSFVWNKNTAGSFSVTMTYSYICFWIGTYSNLNFLSLVFFCICGVMLHEWSYGLRSSILRLLHGDHGSPMAESPSLSRAFLPGCLRIIN